MNLPDSQITSIDVPEIQEAFADSLGMFTFDGNTLRVEFCVTRLDKPNPPNPPSAKRYTACRLVLTPDVAFNFAGQLQQLMQQLEKQGAIKKTPTATPQKH